MEQLTASKNNECSCASPFNTFFFNEVNQAKGKKTAKCNKNTLHKDYASHFFGKNRFIPGAGAFLHNVLIRGIYSQCKGRKAVCYQIDPENMYGQKRHREADQGSNKHYQDFTNITGKQVVYKLTDIGVYSATLFNGSNNRCKIIIGDDDFRHLLGDISAGDSHSNPDVSFLNSWRIINAISGHGNHLSPVTPCLNDP